MFMRNVIGGVLALFAVGMMFATPTMAATATCTNITLADDSNSTINPQTTNGASPQNNTTYGPVTYGDTMGVSGKTYAKTSPSTQCSVMPPGTAITISSTPPTPSLTAQEWNAASCTGMPDNSPVGSAVLGIGTYQLTDQQFAVNASNNVTEPVYPATTHVSFLNNFYQGTGGTPSYVSSQSPCITVTVNAVNPNTITCPNDDTMVIEPTAASGDNPTTPDFNGSWQYQFNVKNCTLSPYAVKVQGGTAGWLTNNQTNVSYLTGSGASGSCASDSSTPNCQVKLVGNGKNAVIIVKATLASEETMTVTVNVQGTTPPSPDPDPALSVSGAWSVAWAGGKSDYTDFVTICVTSTTCQ